MLSDGRSGVAPDAGDCHESICDRRVLRHHHGIIFFAVEACKHRMFAVLLWALRVHLLFAAARISSDLPLTQFCVVCPFVYGLGS